MPRYGLPERPEQHFIEFLLDQWDASYALGYDITLSSPSAEAFCPIATSIDNAGSVYPSLVVTFSNETTGGQTTYDFATGSGPGQTRQGSLLVTARAQDTEDNSGYTGDSATYSAVDAEAVVDELLDAVERIVAEHAHTPPNTEFSYLGSQPTADIPDDFEDDPPVRQAQRQIAYGWIRTPV